jgi:importin-7
MRERSAWFSQVFCCLSVFSQPVAIMKRRLNTSRVQICEILGYFTYFSQPLSQRLWAYWPVLEAILCTTGWGIEYTENIIVPLDNFICRGTDVFCTSTAPNYRESLFRMVKHCFNLSNSDVCDMEKEFKPITKLLDIVLLNCPGRVDEWVWPYIEICMSRITTSKDRGFSTLLMNVVAAALVYNSELTLKALEMNGKTTEVCGSLSVDTLHHFVLACSDSVSCFARTTVSSLFCDAGVYTVVSDD